jgi:hypothetical protein
MKSDKGASHPNHASIPTKDAIAIVPPKKVSDIQTMMLSPAGNQGRADDHRARRTDNRRLSKHSTTTNRPIKDPTLAISPSPKATSCTLLTARTITTGTKHATRCKAPAASCPSSSSRLWASRHGTALAQADPVVHISLCSKARRMIQATPIAPQSMAEERQTEASACPRR